MSPAAPVQLSYDQLLRLWQNAGQTYGVPWNVLAAINKIESNFGRNMGPSSAGAIGWMQFMPSTWVRWGTDADGERVRRPVEPRRRGLFRCPLPRRVGRRADIRRAVFSYNHADWYVNQVMQLAQLYGSSDTASADAFQKLSRLPALRVRARPAPAELDEARAAVTKASDEYRVALAKAEALADREQELTEGGCDVTALQATGGAEGAVQLGADADVAQAAADRLKARLDAAPGDHGQGCRTRPGGVVQRAGPPDPLGRTRQGTGNYVFPVGGGPSVVSVSHSHHDYPAADIAAPEGTPVYALSDGAVLYAWSWDQRCGTGFTMRTADGQTWTYCHLSYLETDRDAGSRARGRRSGRPGRTDGRRDRPASPPAAAAGRPRIRRTSNGSRASPTPRSGGRTGPATGGAPQSARLPHHPRAD